MSKQEDWWAAASNAAPVPSGSGQSAVPRRNGSQSSVTRPSSSSGTATRRAAAPVVAQRETETVDPLLAGLRAGATKSPPPSAQSNQAGASAMTTPIRSEDVSSRLPGPVRSPQRLGPNKSGDVPPIRGPTFGKRQPASMALSGRSLPGLPRSPPVPRHVIAQIVEYSTGLGRGSADPSARDAAVQVIWSGAASPADILRAVVAGSRASDASFNARVLSFLHWVSFVGGPSTLAAACEPYSVGSSPLGVGICSDVLQASGYGSDVGRGLDPLKGDTALNDAAGEALRSWEDDLGMAASQAGPGSRYPTTTAAAVEMYALVLVRKLGFHARFPEVEANYSLDRFYRQMHVENGADADRAAKNQVRQSGVISWEAAHDGGLLALGGVSVAAALDRCRVPTDIVTFAFADACNAYAFTAYVRSKLGHVPGSKGGHGTVDLEPIRAWLSSRLDAMESRFPEKYRSIRAYVDSNVLISIQEPKSRPSRPESHHRREVPCTFSSFENMHVALSAAMPN